MSRPPHPPFTALALLQKNVKLMRIFRAGAVPGDLASLGANYKWERAHIFAASFTVPVENRRALCPALIDRGGSPTGRVD